MIKRLERLKNTVNKYMADIQPDWPTTCQSEQKSVVKSMTTLTSYHQLTKLRKLLKLTHFCEYIIQFILITQIYGNAYDFFPCYFLNSFQTF
jgi:hypothetical protein